MDWKTSDTPTWGDKPDLCIYRTPFTDNVPAVAEVYFNFPLSDGDIDRDHIATLYKTQGQFRVDTKHVLPPYADVGAWVSEEEASLQIYQIVGWVLSQYAPPKGHLQLL